MIREVSSGAYLRGSGALRHRDFRWVLLGGLSGQSAYWALIIARGVFILAATGSSGLVGLATFAAMAPRFIVPPLSGYVSDRFDRRTVLAAAYGFQLGHAVLLSALALTDSIEVWQIVALALIDGSFRTFQITATQSLIPNLVPRNLLLNAVALNQLAIQGSRLVGPAVIAPLLLLQGPQAAFVASIFLYAFGIASVMAIRVRSSGELTGGEKLAASLWAAYRFVWGNRPLRWLFILVALHCAMTMSFESMLPVLARDALGEATASVSYLMMGVGGGAVVGVVIVAGLQSAALRGQALLVTGLLSGASMVLLAVSSNVTVAIVGAAAMGGSQAAFMAIGIAMIQSLAPDGMRGRITGLEQINIGGNMAVLNLVNGIAADAVGAPAVLTVMGTGFVAVVFISLAVATLRAIYSGALRAASGSVAVHA